MNEKLKGVIKSALPNSLIKRISNSKIDLEFANFIANSAENYSKYVSGDFQGFNERLRPVISNEKKIPDYNVFIQDILTAFMCDYKTDLYNYYKNQEYFIFLRFLSYPYSDGMASYFTPYKSAFAKLEKADILDYGSGIPYGIIYALRENKKWVNSITLIDLDLAHTQFAEFLIKQIAPDVPLKIHRLKNSEDIPMLSNSYNMIFGKDIFEHLKNPMRVLQEIIKYASNTCVCYFDFRDHGEVIYQHVSPNIGYLEFEMEKMGFKSISKIHGLTEFIR